MWYVTLYADAADSLNLLNFTRFQVTGANVISFTSKISMNSLPRVFAEHANVPQLFTDVYRILTKVDNKCGKNVSIQIPLRQ
jgi:hypothetical protein